MCVYLPRGTRGHVPVLGSSGGLRKGRLLVTAFVLRAPTVSGGTEAVRYFHKCSTVATELKLEFAPVGAGEVAAGRRQAS